MDTPKPVTPVNNFNYQPLGLKGLMNNQAFYSNTGTLPTSGNNVQTPTLPLSGDFLNMINSQPARTTPLQSGYDSARKYDRDNLFYDATRDNEEFYAQQQGAAEMLGAGLLRLGLTTVTKLGSGLSYVGAGITNAIASPFWDTEDKLTRFMSATADNAFVNFFNNLEDDIKTDLLPMYQDASDSNKGFFGRAFTDLNFWTDDFVDGAAFMASSMLPGAALGKLGLGAKLVRGLAGTVDKADDASRILTGLRQTGIQGFDDVSRIPQITKLMSNARLARNTDLAVGTVLNTGMESFVEAAEVRKSMQESLRGAINPKTGMSYTEEEISKLSAEAAMGTFKGNMMALMVSNLWETNCFFKKLPFVVGASGGAVKFGKSFLDMATFKATSNLGKFARNAGKGILAEGIWEENAQLAISRLNSSKFLEGGEEGGFGDFFKRYTNQLIDAYNGDDEEASMSIGLGSLLGGIVGGIMQTKGDIREENALSGKVSNYNNIVSSFKGLKDIYETEVVKGKNQNGNDVEKVQ